MVSPKRTVGSMSNSFREHSCQVQIKTTDISVETDLHEEKTVMNLLGIA